MSIQYKKADIVNKPVYITCAKLKAIVRKAELDLTPHGEVWKREIYFFNQYEKSALIAIQHLLADPEKYFSEIYVPLKKKDSYRYVYPETKPAYHSSCECHRLLSDFENYKIPVEILGRGHDEIHRFRKWFETNGHLLDSRSDLFYFRLKNEFQISEAPEYVKYENSGYEEHENLSIEELGARIDARIKEAGRFYYGCKKNTDILRVYSRHAYRGFHSEGLPIPIPGYEEEEIKAFLRDYEERFKKPLQRDLIEFYRRKFNPQINMPGQILDQLGFKQCSSCADTQLA
jgi:hypothetical protein